MVANCQRVVSDDSDQEQHYHYSFSEYFNLFHDLMIKCLSWRSGIKVSSDVGSNFNHKRHVHNMLNNINTYRLSLLGWVF